MAFNSISDLSPVSLLEDLELLDLEENKVEDLAQLWYLGCCVKLRTLSLEGNPVCTCPAPGVSEVHEGFMAAGGTEHESDEALLLCGRAD